MRKTTETCELADILTVISGVKRSQSIDDIRHVLILQRDSVLPLSGGTWPTSNKDLIAKHLGAFTTFIKSIDFDKLNQ